MILDNLLGFFSAYQLYSLKEGDKEHVIFFNGSRYSIPDKEKISRMIKLLQNSLNDHDHISNRVKEFNEIVNQDYNNDIKKVKSKIIKDGFIYLLYCNSTKLHKIGSTKNVSDRIKNLKTANPMIELLHSSKVSDILIEKEIHKLYESKRVNGEWFDLTNDDVENILNYLENK